MDIRQRHGLCSMDGRADQSKFTTRGRERKMVQRFGDRSAITNMSASESCQDIPEVSSTDLQQTISDDLNCPSPVIHRNFTKAAEKATRRQRKRSVFVPESPSTSDMSNLNPIRSPLASLEGSDVDETGHGLHDRIHLLDRDTNNVRTAVKKVHNSEHDTDDNLLDIKDNPTQHDTFEEYAESNVHHDADNPEDIRDNAGQVDE